MGCDVEMRAVPESVGARSGARIDLGPIVQALERELGGEAPTERIEALLRDLLASEFKDARVTAFLPMACLANSR